jgi:hypothetical protein
MTRILEKRGSEGIGVYIVVGVGDNDVGLRLEAARGGWGIPHRIGSKLFKSGERGFKKL